MVLRDPLLVVREDFVVGRRLLGDSRSGREEDSATVSGYREGFVHPNPGTNVLFEAYHDPPAAERHQSISRMTSPSRKIDPATTIRGARRHAASSASRGEGSAATASSGAIARARSASIAGSAARRFDARVTTSPLPAGSSARNMPSTSLSRIAPKTSGGL